MLSLNDATFLMYRGETFKHGVVGSELYTPELDFLSPVNIMCSVLSVVGMIDHGRPGR